MPRKKTTPDLKLVTTAKPPLFVHGDHAEVAKSALRYLADHADDVFRFDNKLAFVKHSDDGTAHIHIAGVQDIRMIVAEHMQPYVKARTAAVRKSRCRRTSRG